MVTCRALQLGALLTFSVLLARWLVNPFSPLRLPSLDQRGLGQQWRPEDLDAASCQHTKQLRVCSHRIDASEVGAGIASQEALKRLWAAGVSCFDADVLVTRDGVLLLAHPERLAQALGPSAPPTAASDPSQFEHSQLVAWGAKEAVIPRLSTVLRNFGLLLRRQGMRYPAGGYVPDVAREPVILLDLKGAAFTAGHVFAAIQAAREASILRHTMIWCIDGHPQADEVQAAVRRASHSVALIRSYPDRQMTIHGKMIAPGAKITTAIRDAYQAVGPGLRIADHFFVDAQAAGLPVFLWVVDDPPSLRHALKVGAAVAISNKPLTLQRSLQEWQAYCENKGR